MGDVQVRNSSALFRNRALIPRLSRTMLLTLLLSFLFLVYARADNRELIPVDAPTNLTLLEIKNRQVLIAWDPVDPQSVRGNFKGYLVRTWNHAGSQVYAFPPQVTKASVEFFPFSKNFITVSARNEKYVGAPSEAISFDAPQIEPNHPYVLNVFTLSSKSIFIQWNRPTQPNGILLGYKIYCSELNDTFPNVKIRQSSHQINDPEKFQAKLTGLEEGKRYEIGITAVNCAGESSTQTAEITLEPHTSAEPFPPKFRYKIGYTTPNREEVCYNSPPSVVTPADEEDKEEFDYYDNLLANGTKIVKPKPTASGTGDGKPCLVDCLVLWIPDVRNNPGEHFYLKYKVKGGEEYQVTEPEMSEDFIILRDFDSCKNYEIVLVAVDGEYSTESGVLITPAKV